MCVYWTFVYYVIYNKSLEVSGQYSFFSLNATKWLYYNIPIINATQWDVLLQYVIATTSCNLLY